MRSYRMRRIQYKPSSFQLNNAGPQLHSDAQYAKARAQVRGCRHPPLLQQPCAQLDPVQRYVLFDFEDKLESQCAEFVNLVRAIGVGDTHAAVLKDIGDTLIGERGVQRKNSNVFLSFVSKVQRPLELTLRQLGRVR